MSKREGKKNDSCFRLLLLFYCDICSSQLVHLAVVAVAQSLSRLDWLVSIIEQDIDPLMAVPLVCEVHEQA